MSVTSDFIVTSFIKNARNNFLDTYLVKRGDFSSGEIFLKVNNLNGFSKIYTFIKTKIKNPWEPYGSEDWQEDNIVEKKIRKILNIDPDIWIIEINDKVWNFPNLLTKT